MPRRCLLVDAIVGRPLAALIAAAPGCVPHLYTTGPDDTGGCGVAWEATPNAWTTPEQTGPPEGTCGEGFAPGQRIPDLRLLDQHGDTVSSWQFFGDVLVLDVSTMWCVPCQELAQTTQETYELFAPRGFMYLTILQQDTDLEPPDRDDLVVWADAFGIEVPVLADGELLALGAVVGDTYPGLAVVGRDLRVAEQVTTPDDRSLRAAIQRVLRQ